MNHNCLLTTVLCSVVLFSGAVSAVDRKLGSTRGMAPETSVGLTEAGKKLEAESAGMLNALGAEIVQALPKIDDSKKPACLEALKAEEAPAKNAAATAKALRRCRGREADLSQLVRTTSLDVTLPLSCSDGQE
jgi:hypothetical protein